jgi:hypothetical protein
MAIEVDKQAYAQAELSCNTRIDPGACTGNELTIESIFGVLRTRASRLNLLATCNSVKLESLVFSPSLSIARWCSRTGQHMQGHPKVTQNLGSICLHVPTTYSTAMRLAFIVHLVVVRQGFNPNKPLVFAVNW